jgi:hypothetical protein
LGHIQIAGERFGSLACVSPGVELRNHDARGYWFRGTPGAYASEFCDSANFLFFGA